KHDTEEMRSLPAATLAAEWDEAFRSRILSYPEEEEFLRLMARRLAGRDLTSIGSGLGFQELLYASSGARVRCVDVVQSNLDVVTRVATYKGLSVSTQLVPDITQPLYGLSGSADVVLFYGSLMTMPEPLQREALSEAFAVLRPHGVIVLMLYTWEFARRACGWETPAAFDHKAFARASDPSVNGQDCPWSDWHDAKKLVALSPLGTRVRRHQEWNHRLYAWYELRKSGPPLPSRRFFRARRLGTGAPVAHLSMSDWEAAEGQVVSTRTGLQLSMPPGISYAALSPVTMGETRHANALVVDATVKTGSIAVSLLDVGRDIFVGNLIISNADSVGPYLMRFPTLPAAWRVVISNYDPGHQAPAHSVIRWIRLLERPSVEPP
ncbi:MAG TPA: methyltransferase domain-containing protein, partial [Acidimicrobiales bacterium]|nr:methyltransferase domain-containing protein [Acidimicrobiales bacterium]